MAVRIVGARLLSTAAKDHVTREGATGKRAQDDSTCRQTDFAFSSASTVSPSEVRHFDDLSGEWWDLNGLFAALHDYNPHRVGFIKDNLQKICLFQEILRHRGVQNGEKEAASAPQAKDTHGVLKGIRILDVGCGGGILAEVMAREGAFVTGVDASPDAVRVAESRRTKGPYAADVRDRQRYFHGSLEEFCSGSAAQAPTSLPDSRFPNPPRSLFDVVVCSEMLEHVEGGLTGVENVIATAARKALAPGGMFVLSTLNRTPENYLASIVTAEHICGLVPKGTHDWQKFLKPEELQEIGERHGLRLLEQRGFFYFPVLRAFVREPLCRFMFAMAFEKI
ncbi:3-demethylubiquinone-9 3-O-methyltransferase [Besnoitia besnoiti]|uniref:Ubiquinone biosynthesis O-methyltransferase, mitochondrial n=1 Tax=Besnoitia besnoiti TaxID=94643 RepID=A0A2A9MFR9_BESBE|nr:3-demethylubiquinone-9 3-O-methyltransferase [Besnoitia besnoiti]PFH36779.1 3-demethylubiquinone-9 3-O-methyltransferase [Besnoitia besnoiti]